MATLGGTRRLVSEKAADKFPRDLRRLDAKIRFSTLEHTQTCLVPHSL